MELRSDFVHERLWAVSGNGYFTVSEIDCTQGWWRTKLSFTKDEIKIFTSCAVSGNPDQAWCTIPLVDGSEYEISNNVNNDLVGTGKLDRVIASIAVVLGGKGALYIDSIDIRATGNNSTMTGD